VLGPKQITEHPHSFLVPHRRLLRCTLPPAELWRSWIQYIPSLQPILQDMWLYGMVQFQRHENRSLIANAGISRPSATPHRCTEAPTGNHGRYTWPTSVTQKRFSTQYLFNSHKGVFFIHTKIPPNTFEWTFPEHSILVESALRKETPISPGRAKGILSILLLIYYSRHQLINAGS